MTNVVEQIVKLIGEPRNYGTPMFKSELKFVVFFFSFLFPLSSCSDNVKQTRFKTAYHYADNILPF